MRWCRRGLRGIGAMDDVAAATKCPPWDARPYNRRIVPRLATRVESGAHRSSTCWLWRSARDGEELVLRARRGTDSSLEGANHIVSRWGLVQASIQALPETSLQRRPLSRLRPRLLDARSSGERLPSTSTIQLAAGCRTGIPACGWLEADSRPRQTSATRSPKLVRLVELLQREGAGAGDPRSSSQHAMIQSRLRGTVGSARMRAPRASRRSARALDAERSMPAAEMARH